MDNNYTIRMPLVSIITPAYNRAAFLEETIQSVLNQDYPNIEYIVLDDGSKDNTQEILTKYGDKIHWMTHLNMGETATVNKGIRLARGEYICVVNSDDPLLPNAVSRAIEFLQEYPRALAAYPDWLEIDSDSIPIKEHILPDYSLWLMLKEFNVSIGPGVFIRSKAFEIIGMRDENFRYVGDLDFWHRLAALNALVHIPQVLATHRTHGESESSSGKGAKMADEIVGMVYKLFKDKSLPKWAKAMRSYTLSVAHHDAIFYCGSDSMSKVRHRLVSVLYNPPAYVHQCAIGVDSPFHTKICQKIWPIISKLGARLPEKSNTLEISQLPESSTHLPKIAFISHVLPPSWSGQAVVIERLLNHLDPNDYCLISLRDYSIASSLENNRRLKGPYYVLPKESEIFHLSRLKIIKQTGYLLRIIFRGLSIAKIARAENCKIILAGTGDPMDLPAAFIASVLLRLPFIPYLFDDFTYQWTDSITRSNAATAEKIMFPRATKIIVPNEFLRDEILKRHGIVSVIIRNPSEDIKSYPDASASVYKENAGEIKIVFTGAVYHVNFNAFRNVISAINLFGANSCKLHIYTAQSVSWLESEGVCGEAVIFHQHVPPDEVAEAQFNASILLIPFAFNSIVPEIIKTSAPGKLGDYLASGTPILAHVPPDSFVSWYINKYQCGLVVDREDPNELVKVISQLSTDQTTNQQIIRNALDRAKHDFHPNASRETFQRVLELLK